MTHVLHAVSGADGRFPPIRRYLVRRVGSPRTPHLVLLQPRVRFEGMPRLSGTTCGCFSYLKSPSLKTVSVHSVKRLDVRPLTSYHRSWSYPDPGALSLRQMCTLRAARWLIHRTLWRTSISPDPGLRLREPWAPNIPPLMTEPITQVSKRNSPPLRQTKPSSKSRGS